MRYIIFVTDKAQNYPKGTCFTEAEAKKIIAKAKQSRTMEGQHILADFSKNTKLGEISRNKPFMSFGLRLISQEDFASVRWL